MLVEKYIRDALMLWTTIDPIGTLSLFAVLTAQLTAEERKKTALKATLYATAILVGAIVIGQILLGGLGVQLVSLQIAGGIILFLFALQMIFGTVGKTSAQSERDHDLAVFPLAVPSIGGYVNYFITPRLSTELRADVFWIQAGDFTGSMVEFYAGLEYRIWDNIAVGAAYDRLQVGVNTGDVDANLGFNLVYLYGSLYFFSI